MNTEKTIDITPDWPKLAHYCAQAAADTRGLVAQGGAIMPGEGGIYVRLSPSPEGYPAVYAWSAGKARKVPRSWESVKRSAYAVWEES